MSEIIQHSFSEMSAEANLQFNQKTVGWAIQEPIYQN